MKRAFNNKGTKQKKLLAQVLLLCALSMSCQQKQASPIHQTANTPPQAAPSTKPQVFIYHVDGVVTRTNPNYPSIELNHEEIPGHMNAMIMEWYVKDVSLLDSIKPGDKVEFTLEVTQGGSEIITGIKKRNGKTP